MNGRLPDDIIVTHNRERCITVENDNGNNNTDNNNSRRVFVYARNNIIVSEYNRYNVNNSESLVAERDALL